MKFQLMQPGQEKLAIEIVSATFDEFVAPGYSEEGIEEFYRFADRDSLAERSRINHFTVLAVEDELPMGVIEIRDNRHISMFFVLKEFQNSGVGRALLKDAVGRLLKKQNDIQILTVNSSPNSVSAYEKMGFTVTANEQCINGIRFVPMELKLHSEDKYMK